jgi:hypothetical protein
VGGTTPPSPSTLDRLGGYELIFELARSFEPMPNVPTRQEEIEGAVLAYIDTHGKIRNADVHVLLDVEPDLARRTLNRLREHSVIMLGSKAATGRAVFYVRAASSSKR